MPGFAPSTRVRKPVSRTHAGTPALKPALNRGAGYSLICSAPSLNAAMLSFLLLLAAWQGTDVPPQCQARLELQQHDNMLTVTGHCRNLLPTAGRYRYELAVLRESTGGRSQNTQRGEFSMAPQEEVSLSQSSVNAGPRDTYSIHLRVLDLNGHTLAQDSVRQISKH